MGDGDQPSRDAVYKQSPPENQGSQTISQDLSSLPDAVSRKRSTGDEDGGRDHRRSDDSTSEHEELKQADSLPHADTNTDEIRSWLGGINFDVHGAGVEARMLTCGQSTIAVFDRLSGRDSFQTASPLVGILKTQLQDVTGFAAKRTSLQGIEQTLRSQGPGSHTVVFVAWRSPNDEPSAHTFNAFYDGEKRHALDGQDAAVQEWPPTSTSAITQRSSGVSTRQRIQFHHWTVSASARAFALRILPLDLVGPQAQGCHTRNRRRRGLGWILTR